MIYKSLQDGVDKTKQPSNDKCQKIRRSLYKRNRIGCDKFNQCELYSVSYVAGKRTE